MPTLIHNPEKIALRLKGCYIKTINNYPNVFNREKGDYLLLNLNILLEMLKYIHYSENGIILISDKFIRVLIFYIFITGKEYENRKYEILNKHIPTDIKNKILNDLLQDYCLCNDISISMFNSYIKKHINKDII